MNHKVTLLEEDDYDLNDDVAPEYDFAGIREQAKAEGREYRGHLWTLDSTCAKCVRSFHVGRRSQRGPIAVHPREESSITG